MSDIQILGLIQLLIGILSLIFCRRLAKLIRDGFTPFGKDMPEWVAITGLIIAAIMIIQNGLQWMFG